MAIGLSPTAQDFARDLAAAWANETISQSVIISVRPGGHGLEVSSDHLPAVLQPPMGILRELALDQLIYLEVWHRYMDNVYIAGDQPDVEASLIVVQYEMTLLHSLSVRFGHGKGAFVG